MDAGVRRTAPRTARFDVFVMYNQPIRHNSYSILAVQRSSRERVYTSPGSGDEVQAIANPLRQRGSSLSAFAQRLLSIDFFQLQLLCQLLIFLEKLIDFLNVIIRLHGQCCFVNWSNNLLFFFQVICYLCHCFIFLDFLDNQ